MRPMVVMDLELTVRKPLLQLGYQAAMEAQRGGRRTGRRQCDASATGRNRARGADFEVQAKSKMTCRAS